MAKVLFAVRYVFPGVLILFGTLWIFVDKDTGPEAFSLFAGAGISILLLNTLFRIGVSGDADRDREEEAREYFSKHGHWPDEAANRDRR